MSQDPLATVTITAVGLHVCVYMYISINIDR